MFIIYLVFLFFLHILIIVLLIFSMQFIKIHIETIEKRILIFFIDQNVKYQIMEGIILGYRFFIGQLVNL